MGHASNEWLQLELRINSIPFKYLSYTLYIRNSWLQKKPYPLRNGWLQLLFSNKGTLHSEKSYSLRLNAVTFKEIFFRSNYFGSQPFLISCYFTRIFVHLPVIVAVCYFSVHKLIGWDLENIYLFKSNSRNTKKRKEIHTTESHFDILLLSASIVEFE